MTSSAVTSLASATDKQTSVAGSSCTMSSAVTDETDLGSAQLDKVLGV